MGKGGQNALANLNNMLFQMVQLKQKGQFEDTKITAGQMKDANDRIKLLSNIAEKQGDPDGSISKKIKELLDSKPVAPKRNFFGLQDEGGGILSKIFGGGGATNVGTAGLDSKPTFPALPSSTLTAPGQLTEGATPLPTEQPELKAPTINRNLTDSFAPAGEAFTSPEELDAKITSERLKSPSGRIAQSRKEIATGLGYSSTQGLPTKAREIINKASVEKEKLFQQANDPQSALGKQLFDLTGKNLKDMTEPERESALKDLAKIKAQLDTPDSTDFTRKWEISKRMAGKSITGQPTDEQTKAVFDTFATAGSERAFVAKAVENRLIFASKKEVKEAGGRDGFIKKARSEAQEIYRGASTDTSTAKPTGEVKIAPQIMTQLNNILKANKFKTLSEMKTYLKNNTDMLNGLSEDDANQFLRAFAKETSK